MPFSDESLQVAVIDYRPSWVAAFTISVPDLLGHGQIKAPATDVLMAAAERWAVESGWDGP